MNLSVGPGEVVGLIGRNGAGKSTLLRILAAASNPSSGEVRVFGLDPKRDPVALKRSVGYVPDRQLLPAHLFIKNLFEIYADLYPTWDTDFAEKLLARFALTLKLNIGSLSSGQGRALLLITALAHKPKLLLLDEPASGLDPAARREFMQLALEALSDRESTIVFSSHHMTDVERIATRLVVIDRGAVVTDDALDRIREGYSVVALMHSDAGIEGLSAEPTVVCVVRDAAGIQVVLKLPIELCHERLTALGLESASCWRPSLEDLFIALTGGVE